MMLSSKERRHSNGELILSLKGDKTFQVRLKPLGDICTHLNQDLNIVFVQNCSFENQIKRISLHLRVIIFLFQNRSLLMVSYLY